MDDGSEVQLQGVLNQEASELDDATLNALEEELRAALRSGCRRPLCLEQSVCAVERIVQLNHCGEPVRRLWALRQEAERMGSGGGGGSGGSAPQPGCPSFLALWQESVGLSAQVAFTLRERLSEEERRRVEGVLRGFCEQEEGERLDVKEEPTTAGATGIALHGCETLWQELALGPLPRHSDAQRGEPPLSVPYQGADQRPLSAPAVSSGPNAAAAVAAPASEEDAGGSAARSDQAGSTSDMETGEVTGDLPGLTAVACPCGADTAAAGGEGAEPTPCAVEPARAQHASSDSPVKATATSPNRGDRRVAKSQSKRDSAVEAESGRRRGRSRSRSRERPRQRQRQDSSKRQVQPQAQQLETPQPQPQLQGPRSRGRGLLPGQVEFLRTALLSYMHRKRAAGDAADLSGVHIPHGMRIDLKGAGLSLKRFVQQYMHNEVSVITAGSAAMLVPR